jgi:hypothetical protein
MASPNCSSTKHRHNSRQQIPGRLLRRCIPLRCRRINHGPVDKRRSFVANGHLHTRSLRGSYAWSRRRWIHKSTYHLALDILCNTYMVWNSGISSPRGFVNGKSVISLFVPETYGPSVLKQKAKYLRNRENTTKYKSQMEVEQKSIISTIRLFCTRPFRIPPYLADLTTRPPARRADMFSIMSLLVFPPCNFVSLLRSFPTRVQKQSRIRLTRHRSLIHWARDR